MNTRKGVGAFLHTLLALFTLTNLALGGPDASENTMDRNQVSAFLSRATFGASDSAIDALIGLGSYRAWIDAQFAEEPSYHLEWVTSRAKGVSGIRDLKDAPKAWSRYSDALGYMQRDAWFDIAVHAPDQLRQRVAFALSEIFVISRNNDALLTQPDARLSFYDVLVKDAFANFETLLRDVTYHPSMGRYLSYLGNPKGDPDKGTHPDENYAREVMQLFTIGLYRLNPDGTLQKRNGKPIPTYSQKDIREMARVFTGLTDRNGFFYADEGDTSHRSRTHPMKAVERYHDRGKKQILGHTIAAGGGTKQDINRALHILFMHPNTGPFIARRLIQRLVTDNPSPAYIRRVADAFADNGNGVRGDMKAVVKAILLDPEALYGARRFPKRFGKFREPLLYFTHLFRAFDADNGIHVLKQGDKRLYRYRSFNFNGTGYTRQEGPLEALTVFNYFTPDDGPARLRRRGLTAPELELYGKEGIDEVLMSLINQTDQIYGLFEISAELDLHREIELARQKRFYALVQRLDTLLTGGNMSDESKALIRKYLKNATDEDGNPLTPKKLARFAVGLVMTSPDYALQR